MIRIGTRGSALALAQAAWVAARLDEPSQLVTVTVSGDRAEAVGDKSRWVSELERALLADDVDIAVHSAKDVPSKLSAGLELIAFPARADAGDAICGASSLDALAPGARLGTSSLRRAAQVRAARADIEVVSVRGNVDTRLRKLAEGQFDALVLALAGLRRLGRGGEASGVLEELVPAAGQGALTVQARAGFDSSRVEGLNDAATRLAVEAEREFVRALDASCNTPVGAHARAVDGGRAVELRTWVGLPDGSEWISDVVSGAAGDVAAAAAERMLAVGAGDLLRRAEREAVA